MKTLKQVISENENYSKLIRAVIRRVGIESVEDINSHGIGGGFGGFIYYAETCKFFDTHRKQILEMDQNMAEDCGTGMLEMIQNFNCLKPHYRSKPDYSQDEIARAIYTGKGEDVTQVKNAIAWFSAEEVCRMFEE
jgi:hypothetical protein